MLYEIVDATPNPDHTVTITWADGAHGVVGFTRFMEQGALFSALRDPVWFVREMRILHGGIGLTWPNELEFSADGLRRDAFPDEVTGEEDWVGASRV